MNEHEEHQFNLITRPIAYILLLIRKDKKKVWSKKKEKKSFNQDKLEWMEKGRKKNAKQCEKKRRKLAIPKLRTEPETNEILSCEESIKKKF